MANRLDFPCENVLVLYSKNIRILHMGGGKHSKSSITTLKLELEKKMYLGWVSVLPRRIKGHGFPNIVPAISHMYIV